MNIDDKKNVWMGRNSEQYVMPQRIKIMCIVGGKKICE